MISISSPCWKSKTNARFLADLVSKARRMMEPEQAMPGMCASLSACEQALHDLGRQQEQHNDHGGAHDL